MAKTYRIEASIIISGNGETLPCILKIQSLSTLTTSKILFSGIIMEHGKSWTVKQIITVNEDFSN